MTTFDRRAVLAALGGVAGTAVLAGCSESSGDDGDGGANSVGDTATVDGLAMTLLAADLRQNVTVSPRPQLYGNEETPEGEGTPQTHEVRSSADRQYVVIVLQLSNETDEPLGVPMPGGTAISEGEIYLHKRGTEGDATDENLTQVPAEGNEPETVSGRLTHDGTTYDRLTFALGDYQSELPAGESAAGWILYEVGEDMTPDRLKLVADRNPRTINKRVEWELAASE
ncbi:hypothetical protein [Halosimplex sp. J119]